MIALRLNRCYWDDTYRMLPVSARRSNRKDGDAVGTKRTHPDFMVELYRYHLACSCYSVDGFDQSGHKQFPISSSPDVVGPEIQGNRGAHEISSR